LLPTVLICCHSVFDSELGKEAICGKLVRHVRSRLFKVIKIDTSRKPACDINRVVSSTVCEILQFVM